MLTFTALCIQVTGDVNSQFLSSQAPQRVVMLSSLSEVPNPSRALDVSQFHASQRIIFWVEYLKKRKGK